MVSVNNLVQIKIIVISTSKFEYRDVVTKLKYLPKYLKH